MQQFTNFCSLLSSHVIVTTKLMPPVPITWEQYGMGGGGIWLFQLKEEHLDSNTAHCIGLYPSGPAILSRSHGWLKGRLEGTLQFFKASRHWTVGPWQYVIYYPVANEKFMKERKGKKDATNSGLHCGLQAWWVQYLATCYVWFMLLLRSKVVFLGNAEASEHLLI